MSYASQIFELIILSIPVACLSWTITHEEIFREPREYCQRCVETSKSIFRKKFFYVFTCEYCLSHYITIILLLITGYKLLFHDWRGYLISGLCLVWISNIYMSLFALFRTDLKKEKAKASLEEKKLKK